MSRTLEQFPAPAGLRLPQPRALFEVMAMAEAIAIPWSSFAEALMTDGKLPPASRELAVLRVGWRMGCVYVLSGHLPVARHIGVPEDRVLAALGRRAPEPPDLSLLNAVDELLSKGRIRSRTHRQLLRHFTTQEVLELAILTGQYAMVSMVCETFGLKPERPDTG